MNYAAERFLYRLGQSKDRDGFVLKGAMLFAVRVGQQYRPTRDLDLLGLGEASEAAVATAIRNIATTKVDDDGLIFDVDGLEVYAIREDNAYGGIRVVLQARLAEARIHVQIDVGFGDAITPAATNLQFPTLLADSRGMMPRRSRDTSWGRRSNTSQAGSLTLLIATRWSFV